MLGELGRKKGRTRLGTSNEEHWLLSQPGTCKKLGVLFMHEEHKNKNNKWNT